MYADYMLLDQVNLHGLLIIPYFVKKKYTCTRKGKALQKEAWREEKKRSRNK